MIILDRSRPRTCLRLYRTMHACICFRGFCSRSLLAAMPTSSPSSFSRNSQVHRSHSNASSSSSSDKSKRKRTHAFKIGPPSDLGNTNRKPSKRRKVSRRDERFNAEGYGLCSAASDNDMSDSRVSADENPAPARGHSKSHFRRKSSSYSSSYDGESVQNDNDHDEEDEEEFTVPFIVSESGHSICDLCGHEFARVTDQVLHIKFHKRQQGAFVKVDGMIWTA